MLDATVHALFAAMLATVVAFVIWPVLWERVARASAARSGMSFDAVVTDPARFRRSVRLRGMLALPLVLFSWAIVTALLLTF